MELAIQMLLAISAALFVFGLPIYGISALRHGLKEKKRWAVVRGSIALVVFACGIAGGVVVYRWFADAFNDNRNPKDYTRVLRKWDPSGLATHFPPAIPADATNVHFFYRPGEGQGASILELEYQTTPVQIRQLRTQFLQQKHVTCHGGEENDIVPDWLINLNASGVAFSPFTSDYQIIGLFPPAPVQGSCGLALLMAKNEITYWAVWGGD